ncbi:NADH-quinone oxidoreductase subunit A [Hugenholtzia roseola]|uniref:NADH-quinone oxidoreductase subunit A n=1 Tax=Hugenholtzia roseola TaxID=1002 RepID=UPI000421E1F5|nr:NADH-quinone oxidoreductase subunit A [Hugenholtzia roseola]
MNTTLTQLFFIFVFLIGGLIFAWIATNVGRLFRPYRPNQEKNAIYECGEEPIGRRWGRFNVRYYVLALAFLIFEVEIIFLFPWATLFEKSPAAELSQSTAIFILIEMLFFIAVLFLGLLYLWRKGWLDWEKTATLPKRKSNFLSDIDTVPVSLYDKINAKYANDKKTAE